MKTKINKSFVVALLLVLGLTLSANADIVTIGPAPGGNGWFNGAIAYDQSDTHAETYEMAFGQSFVAPTSSVPLRLTGFSSQAYAGYTWAWAQVRMRVYDSIDYATRTQLYEYTSSGATGDDAVYFSGGSTWLDNRGDDPTWLFKDANVGNATLTSGNTYYWEVEFLQKLSAGSPNAITYVRPCYGRSAGSTSGGDSWIVGQSYQRWSDGTYDGLNGADSNFKMEFLVIPEPATLALLALGGSGMLLRRLKRGRNRK